MNRPSTDWKALEKKLAGENNRQERLALLDHLIEHYLFSNPVKAQKILKKEAKFLDKGDYNYRLHSLKAFAYNQKYEFQKAEDHYLHAIALIEEQGNAHEQAESYLDYAGVCINLKKLDQAEQLLERTAQLLKVFPDEKLRARLYCREGYLHLHEGNYSKTAEYLLESNNILQQRTYLSPKDYYFLLLIHSGLGKVYERNNEWKKCVESYKMVVETSERLQLTSRLSWHYLNLGSACLAISDNEQAEHFFQKTLKVKSDSSELARASALTNIGYLRFQEGKHKEALKIYGKAEKLFRKINDKDHYNFSILARWRAQIYTELDQKEEALEQLLQAYYHAKEIEDYKQISGIYKEIAALYAAMEDYQNAYEYQLLYDRYAEQYAEQLNQRKIMELEVKYKAEQKEREAELLRLQATRLQLKALRAQMNPHFMFNALNAIQNYMTSNDLRSAAKYLAKFATLMRKSLEYSDQEIIPLEEEIEFLREYLEINAGLRFENRLKYFIEVDDELEEDIMGVPTMIIQPYVENAIEHGLRSRDKGEIRISFKPADQDNILCTVTDNGIGRVEATRIRQSDPLHGQHKSRGTSITEKRLQVFHNSDEGVFVKTIDLFDPQTGQAAGTRVELIIPVTSIHKQGII